MTTINILKDRRKYLVWMQTRNPNDLYISQAIDELDFIFEKLKEYHERDSKKLSDPGK